MYKPDRVIVARLREYDPDLGVRWNHTRERWQVTWRGKDVWCVANDDGGYRPLDERVVTQAKLHDTWQHKSADAMCRIQQEENHRLSRAQRAKLQDDFGQYVKEDMFGQVFGCGVFPGWSPPSGARA